MPSSDNGYETFLSNNGDREESHVPMKSWNGGLRPKANRQAPSCDEDVLPRIFRRYVNASGAQDVQIQNGMRWGTLSGRRLLYAGAGYLFGTVPTIPGQTRGDQAGFHRRGPSPINYTAMWDAGPGSNPRNPGGPGRIAAPIYVNPMTG